MSSAAGAILSTAEIQGDWKKREFVEIIKINVLKVAQFLNDFDATVRERLGTLNAKLNRIERNIDYCEASFDSVIKGGNDL